MVRFSAVGTAATAGAAAADAAGPQQAGRQSLRLVRYLMRSAPSGRLLDHPG